MPSMIAELIGWSKLTEDLAGVCQYGFGGLFERLDGGCVGLEYSLLQILLSGLLVWLVPELVQLLFEVVGLGERFIVS
jgi:hypothetical protein